MTMPVSEEFLRGELAPLHVSILAVLRASGGRLWMTDLAYELRRRGISVQRVSSALRELRRRDLVRGPLSRAHAYELTVDGWDTVRPQHSGARRQVGRTGGSQHPTQVKGET